MAAAGVALVTAGQASDARPCNGYPNTQKMNPLPTCGSQGVLVRIWITPLLGGKQLPKHGVKFLSIHFFCETGLILRSRLFSL